VITGVANPTIESAQELMKHPGIRLLVVTGGPDVVRVAMNSGKRAICAGRQSPVVVDETADIDKAAREIIWGASTKQHHLHGREETIAVASIADRLLASMDRQARSCFRASASPSSKVIFTEIKGPR
jgi:propionaldehyde dehydrogenase